MDTDSAARARVAVRRTPQQAARKAQRDDLRAFDGDIGSFDDGVDGVAGLEPEKFHRASGDDGAECARTRLDDYLGDHLVRNDFLYRAANVVADAGLTHGLRGNVVAG